MHSTFVFYQRNFVVLNMEIKTMSINTHCLLCMVIVLKTYFVFSCVYMYVCVPKEARSTGVPWGCSNRWLSAA